mmetsp:Transcript_39086/g.84120  ORF Transcript_39086/g.84120 Transcript_39086/m.84120 type:complete len:211 (+) Transcript_39086:607-1239(+)
MAFSCSSLRRTLRSCTCKARSAFSILALLCREASASSSSKPSCCRCSPFICASSCRHCPCASVSAAPIMPRASRSQVASRPKVPSSPRSRAPMRASSRAWILSICTSNSSLSSSQRFCSAITSCWTRSANWATLASADPARGICTRALGDVSLKASHLSTSCRCCVARRWAKSMEVRGSGQASCARKMLAMRLASGACMTPRAKFRRVFF